METARIAKVNFKVRFSEKMTLKDKRSRVSPVLAKLHSAFHCASLEIGTGNNPNRFELVCVLVSSSSDDARSRIDKLIEYVSNTFRSEELVESSVEWLE